MSDVKNFGLTGVGQQVQLGKGGAQLASDSDKIVVKDHTGALTNVQAADPVAEQDVVTKTYLEAQTGMSFTLGSPTDGSLSDGAVALTGATTVTNAVDQLNEILAKLVPAAPSNFPGGQTLTLTSSSTGLLASGSVPDNTNGGTLPAVAGASVTRVTTSSVSTNSIGDNGTTGFVGPGDSGTVQALVNNVVVDSQAMTTGSNNKSSGVLRITNDQSYPLSTPGFWESFRANITGATVADGWNRLKLNHTAASATSDLYMVYDTLTSNPTVTSGSVTENTAGTYAYSSGVPHYGTGGILNVSFTASNLAGECYKSGNILGVTASNSILTGANYAAGAGGLPSILSRNMSPFAATNLAINVDGTNVHNSGQITGSATNLNGTGSAAFGPTILVKRGTTTRIDEMNIPVSIAVNGGPSSAVAIRVPMTNGDNPSDSITASSTWDNTASTNAWDASVVAGLLSQNTTNYGIGYLPAGPDLSSHNSTQYVTFMIRRTAVSKFDISVTGTYAGLWVKLVGLTEQYTSTANGWYTMSTLYGGAGYPGDQAGANGSLGCALGAVASGTGSWTATFGTLSSTNATSNIILVRFKLTAGQSISALSFVPATR